MAPGTGANRFSFSTHPRRAANVIVDLAIDLGQIHLHDLTRCETAVIVGPIVAVIAAIELWMFHRSPPRLTASQ